MSSKVVVIGAGASGLPALKTCLEEGLDAICFEKTDDIGGLWRYRDTITDVASVFKTTIINSSKEASAYSDFPPPPQFPNFMHNTLMAKYFDLYAQNFNLRPRIQFKTQVLRIEKSPNYSQTGEWIVTTQNLETGVTEQTVASAVIVSNGHHSEPNIPKFVGLSEFKGQVLHTHSYKDFRGFENKRVLVIGIGNSGGDAAVELSRISSQVLLSTRSGTWVLNRVGENGKPLDMVFIRRFNVLLSKIIPGCIMNKGAELKLNFRFDHELYNLKPKHQVFGQHPMVNDDLPNRILSGTVIIKGNVSYFTPTGVVFEGEESTEYELDTIILATGYKITFPFLDDKIIPVSKDNDISLYKFIFPLNLEHPTLAVVGLIQPFGSVMPISEMQARYVARVFKGHCKLPDKEQMLKEIDEEHRTIKERYSNSPRHTIQVDGLPYTDSLAEQIGAKPDLWKLAFKDFWLFLAVYFGPYASYQYRLNGPHAWNGAREAILGIDERIKVPLSTNKGIKNKVKRVSESSEEQATEKYNSQHLPASLQLLVYVFLGLVMLFFFHYKVFGGTRDLMH